MQSPNRRSMKDILYEADGIAQERSHNIILLSPFILIVVGQLAAWFVAPVVGRWSWAYLFGGYWISLSAIMYWGGGRKAIVRWLQPSQGGLLWPLVAVAFSLGSTLWMVIPNWQILLRPDLLILSISFSLINPCLEESYWRGLIIDAAERWPKGLVILYSGFAFSINHLFVMVLVPAGRNPFVWVFQLITGLLLGIVYTKTKSLRWPILSHALINFLSLSVAMFLNIYVPGPPG